MYCLKSDRIRIDRHIVSVCHEFFSISCRSDRFWLHSNTCRSSINVLLFRDVFLVCSVVSWILSWFFLRWERLTWDTRFFFVGIVFFVSGGFLSVSIESLFVTSRWRGPSWFFVVFSFDCWSRVLRIELWSLISWWIFLFFLVLLIYNNL